MSGILDLWTERAAIMEFDGGMNRFEAETRAAECYGVTRKEMLKEAANADRHGLTGGHGHSASPLDGKRDADGLSRMQPTPEKENGPMPERQSEAGRDRGELLALRLDSGAEVQR